MRNRRFTALALGVMSLGVLSVQANAGSEQTGTLNVDYSQIVKTVTDAGYTLESVEIEDGVIEADATKDGKEWEITLNAETGAIISVAEDD